MIESIRIGTRGSKLALWQTHWVKATLEKLHPGIVVEVQVIKTKGDKILDVPLAKIGDKGLFTKELERAILDEEVDLAVHSLKDLPTALDEGLAIGAISTREDVRDAFVGCDGVTLKNLPAGAVVGTSSLRRRSQLLAMRPDLKVADIRGNVDTRLRKVREDKLYDGILMAYAGLKRLELDDAVTEVLEPEAMLPAVGQGALAVEIREGDQRLMDLLASLNDDVVRKTVACERAFLRSLEGGCQVPIGAYARKAKDGILFSGFVGDLTGERTFRLDKTYPAEMDPGQMGNTAADVLKGQGAFKVLEEIFQLNRESEYGK